VFARTVEFTPDWGVGGFRVGFKVLGQYETYQRALLKLWAQEEPGALLDHQSFYARTHALLTITENPTTQYQWIAVETSLPSGSTWNPQDHFYVELRFQKLSTSGTVIQQSPRFFGVFTLPDQVNWTHTFEDPCFDYARLQAPGQGYGVLSYDGLTEFPGAPGGSLVGAYVPIDSLPAFEASPVSDISSGAQAAFFVDPPGD
jgi:hypothetical protein